MSVRRFYFTKAGMQFQPMFEVGLYVQYRSMLCEVLLPRAGNSTREQTVIGGVTRPMASIVGGFAMAASVMLNLSPIRDVYGASSAE